MAVAPSDDQGGGADPSAGAAPDHREIRQRAFSGTLWTAVHAVVSTPVNFVANLVVARAVGVTGYGLIAIYAVALSLGTKVAEAGYNGATVNWGVAEDARGNPALTDRLLRQDVGWQLLVEVPLLGVIVAVIGAGHGPAVLVPLLASVLLGAAFAGPAQAVAVANRTAAAARLTMVANVGMQAAVVAVAIETRSPIAVWTARTVALSLIGAAYLVPVERRRRWLLLRPLLPRHMPPGFWRFAAFATLSSVVAELAASRTEVFVLSLYGKTAVIGSFALAFGLANQMTGPVDAAIMPLGIGIIGLVATEPDKAPEALLRSTRVMALLTGALTAVALPVLVVAVPFLYGHQYDTASLLLVPLGLASLLSSLANPLKSFVSARRRADITLRAIVVALVVDGAFAFSLVPVLGVWGAVVANVAGGIGHLPILVGSELQWLELPLRRYVEAARAWLLAVAVAGLAVAGAYAAGPGTAVRVPVAAGIGVVAFGVGSRLLRGGLRAGDGDSLVAAAPLAIHRVLRGGLALVGAP
jgi:O-antigen/teichoic acid export membrane protein